MCFVEKLNGPAGPRMKGHDVPKYLVLIYGNQQTWAEAPESWQRANMAAHGAFQASAGGAVVSTNELEPVGTAVSVRRGPAGPSATDGPFMDTKEVIGGYYVLEAPDVAEAVRLAGQLPEASAPHGGVEIRPIIGPV
jgi:hypothetical protein